MIRPFPGTAFRGAAGGLNYVGWQADIGGWAGSFVDVDIAAFAKSRKKLEQRLRLTLYAERNEGDIDLLDPAPADVQALWLTAR